MKQTSALLGIALCCLYLVVLFLFKPQVFDYQFKESVVNKYLSQDSRLSESETYIAASYLYVAGADPTEYNFQQPPLLKYLFGISISLFNNPLIVQLILGMGYILLTYWFGVLLFEKRSIGALAAMFLILDPLFLSLSAEALLDLGQSVFLFAYIILTLYYPKKYILHGLMLGLAAAAKFWTPVIFTLAFMQIVKYVSRRELDIKGQLICFISAVSSFCLIYTQSFVQQGWFNIFLFQIKILIYWINNSISTFLGANTLLFLTGFYQSWQSSKLWVRDSLWSILWPIGIAVSIWKIIHFSRIKYFVVKHVVYIFPLLYLQSLSIQAPFVSYFIILLPFIYIILSKEIVDLWNRRLN